MDRGQCGAGGGRQSPAGCHPDGLRHGAGLLLSLGAGWWAAMRADTTVIPRCPRGSPLPSAGAPRAPKDFHAPQHRLVAGRCADLRDHPAAPVRGAPLAGVASAILSSCDGIVAAAVRLAPSASCRPAGGWPVRQPRRTGLTPRQFIILQAVAEADGLSQTGIMAATGIDRSSTADLVRWWPTDGSSAGAPSGTRGSMPCGSHQKGDASWRGAFLRHLRLSKLCCLQFHLPNAKLSLLLSP